MLKTSSNRIANFTNVKTRNSEDGATNTIAKNLAKIKINQKIY